MRGLVAFPSSLVSPAEASPVGRDTSGDVLIPAISPPGTGVPKIGAPTTDVVPGTISSIPQKSPISIGVSGLWFIRQVASELGVSVRTVHQHIKARKLSSIKLDGLLKFRPSDVERFIEKRMRRAA